MKRIKITFLLSFFCFSCYHHRDFNKEKDLLAYKNPSFLGGCQRPDNCHKSWKGEEYQAALHEERCLRLRKARDLRQKEEQRRANIHQLKKVHVCYEKFCAKLRKRFEYSKEKNIKLENKINKFLDSLKKYHEILSKQASRGEKSAYDYYEMHIDRLVKLIAYLNLIIRRMDESIESMIMSINIDYNDNRKEISFQENFLRYFQNMFNTYYKKNFQSYFDDFIKRVKKNEEEGFFKGPFISECERRIKKVKEIQSDFEKWFSFLNEQFKENHILI